jgi:hypothetical protein
VQPHLPEARLDLRQPPVYGRSRLCQVHLYAAGWRSLLRHDRRRLRRNTRLSRDLPEWRQVRRAEHLQHGRGCRASAAPPGAHRATVGHLARANAAPGAVPPSAVAATTGATAGSHPATLPIPRRHRMSAPAGQCGGAREVSP